MTKPNPTVTVYSKGTRTYLKLPHARHDLVIDREAVPHPFFEMLLQYGTADIPSWWVRPKDLSAFIPTPEEQEAARKRKEAKEQKEREKQRRNRRAGLFNSHYAMVEEMLIVPRSLRMEGARLDPNNLPPGMFIDSNGEPQLLPSTPLIRAMQQYNHNPHDPIPFGKKIRKMFLSHLKYIRQDVEGAMYGEQNPDLTHDPLNDGSPDNPNRGS